MTPGVGGRTKQTYVVPTQTLKIEPYVPSITTREVGNWGRRVRLDKNSVCSLGRNRPKNLQNQNREASLFAPNNMSPTMLISAIIRSCMPIALRPQPRNRLKLKLLSSRRLGKVPSHRDRGGFGSSVGPPHSPCFCALFAKLAHPILSTDGPPTPTKLLSSDGWGGSVPVAAGGGRFLC